MFGGLFAGMFGWLGFHKQAKAANSGVKGFVLFRINVGSLSPLRAEVFIERLKDKLKKIDGWEYIFQPFRPNGDYCESSTTQVFLVDKNGNKEEVMPSLVDFGSNFPEFVLTDEIRDKVADYVLLMLGAPVIKVELTREEIDSCIDETYDDIKCYDKRINALSVRGVGLLKKGALARVRIIWGPANPMDEEGQGFEDFYEFHKELKEL